MGIRWHGAHTLGDLGGAEGGLNQDIATLGTQSRRDSLCEGVNTLEELGTSLNTEFEILMRTRGVSCGMTGELRELRKSHLASSSHCENGSETYLVSKSLLLQVEPRGSGNRGTPGGSREDRSPARESSLHHDEKGRCGKGRNANKRVEKRPEKTIKLSKKKLPDSKQFWRRRKRWEERKRRMEREEEEEEEEEMKPKLGKFSRRFSIPGCLGAEAARRSRGPFPREFGYSEQFLLGLHTSKSKLRTQQKRKQKIKKGKQHGEQKKEKKDRTEEKKRSGRKECELTAEPQPNRTIS